MQNEIFKTIAGILCLMIGPYLVLYYQKLKKEKKAGGLTYQIQIAGISLFVCGIILIFQGIIKISLK